MGKLMLTMSTVFVGKVIWSLTLMILAMVPILTNWKRWVRMGALMLQNKPCNGPDGKCFRGQQDGRENERKRAEEQTLTKADLTYQSNKLILWHFPSSSLSLKKKLLCTVVLGRGTKSCMVRYNFKVKRFTVHLRHCTCWVQKTGRATKGQHFSSCS